mmetsp:Transcript_9092/g.19619  ORF Transcript_9092/g.19619 Transcript_9092/m.19619 type:complete len:111 (-) Transcript_9092:220-552(-)|eukprot:CAMPEP_0168753322 /NCGR_PEP_ID=MMETSP0724-20121128/18872_1 /TAXON_ID=265536 /ORGANISM="Amphiprora sp., Strain CCMP467" /LENGTH=110 /DNA_ID=CAMNT_0008801659 /DNA_START=90 /DNA_END=422 /DNA_ORIENTATION=+
MLTAAIRSGRVQVARLATPMIFSTQRFSTLGDTLGKKEKVEEDRFVRELEKKYIAKKKAEMEEQMQADDEKKFMEQIAPAMAEAEVLLSKTGESVSHDALEGLAKWKVGL